ncbi:MAG: TonB-dependent receptor, partial [Bryobacterales bacterium]|nr:TonB-dependent receptor [Bryobacterales bacterium]
MFLVAVCLLAALAPQPAGAQDYRARVQGSVLDQSEAAVVGAKVTLLNVNTGVETNRPSDATGHFLFDYVPPGTYTVKVEMAGFAPFTQENITVLTRGDVTVNAKLAISGVTQTVNVSEVALTLETNTTTMAQTVTGKMLGDLPVLARNPFTLVLLDPAVVNKYWDVSHRNPFYMQAANGVDIGGNTGGRNDLLLDGVPIGVDSRGSYAPNMDAVQEVSIQQNSVDAEFGFSAGGNMSVSMKSGTNDYHGTVYYFGRRPKLNALANRYTRSVNVVKQDMYGLTAGGPIAKNKLFTFFSYEKWKATQPREGSRTLPTDLERLGDFSQSKNGVGGLRTIYDPWSTKFDPVTSTATRTPFAGNIIPANRIDPSSKIIMGDIWKPNGPGDDITGINNYKITYPWWTNYYNFSNRTDWNASEKFRMYARYSYYRTRLDNLNYADSPAVPSDNGGLMDSMNAAADGVYTLNPSTVLNFRFGTTYLEDDYDSEWAKVGEAGLEKVWPGNPWYKSYIQGIPAIYYPSTSISGKAGFGKGSTWFYRPRKYSMSATGAKDHGRHYMKTGLAFRYSYGTSLNPNLMNNYFYPTYTANTFISPNTNLSGDAWATFLLGAIDNNSDARFITPQNIIRKQWGIFFQDDFKLTRRITLNLGLRYEYETAPIEELDRMSRYLDLTQPIPEMQANVPVMPAAVTAIRTSAPIYNGAWVYTDSENRALYKAPKDIFLPRVGLAIRVNERTALRIGYARYAIPMVNAIGSSWYIPADGYNALSNPLPSLEGIPQAVL